MAREKPDYRDTLAQLNRLYPDRELLTIKEVMSLTGLCKDTVRRWFPQATPGRYNKVTVARILCD